MNTDSSKPNYDVLGQIAGDAPKPYRHQPIRAFGESEVRIVHSDVKSYAGPSQFERDIHLSQFNDVDLKFGKIVKSPAWPMVNLLIATVRDQRTSHLFQVQHDWNTLIGKEIDPLVDDWGRHEFSQEPSPYQVLNDAMKHDGPIRVIHDASELSPAEYQARMQDFIKEMSEEELTNARIFRKHVFTPAITPTTCECGKVTGREDGAYDGLMFCQICGTRVKVRERNEEKELLASSLLLPYPVSFFEFMVNDHHWLVEVLEQDDKTAVVKYHFYYEGRWLHASWREYRENPVFKLLKRQVIGALIALESKVAKKSNHEDARPAKTPAMMERLKKVFKEEFNFGYSIVDLTKRKARGEDGVPTESKVRLHFRRGFWRTRLGNRHRVRWCLVGDPFLGFVDKHYRF